MDKIASLALQACVEYMLTSAAYNASLTATAAAKDIEVEAEKAMYRAISSYLSNRTNDSRFVRLTCVLAFKNWHQTSKKRYYDAGQAEVSAADAFISARDRCTRLEDFVVETSDWGAKCGI